MPRLSEWLSDPDQLWSPVGCIQPNHPPSKSLLRLNHHRPDGTVNICLPPGLHLERDEMDPTDIYVHGRGKSLKLLVSEHRRGNASERNDLLCSIHLQLFEQHMEMRVSGSGLHNQLLAVTKDSALDVVGITREPP